MNQKTSFTASRPDDLACSNRFGTFFGVPQTIFNRVWANLSGTDGNSVTYVSMEIGADPDVYHPLKDFLTQHQLTESNDPTIQALLKKYLNGSRKIPNYSGGLGVLAGDTLKSFADTHIPVLAISLMYREGYFSQFVDARVGQIDEKTIWHPEETPTLFQLHEADEPDRPLEIEVPFFTPEGRKEVARAQVWMKMELAQNLDFFVPEFLVDYGLPDSSDWIRDAARQLYNAKSDMTKAIQRRMLGSCILPLMEKLGFTSRTIHLNEQHGVSVTLHMIMRELKKNLGPDFQSTMQDNDILEAVNQVAPRIVYTIHTPVKAGHDRFSRALYSGISQQTCQRFLDLLASDEESPHEYNFTAMAMRINRAVNAVSRLHRDVTRRQFPRYAKKITAITNGVHHLTWISPARSRLFDGEPALQNWRDDPGCFARAHLRKNTVFRRGLLSAWQQDNRLLIDFVNSMLREHRKQMTSTWIDPPNYLSHLRDGDPLDAGTFTVGFARRFSTYKRADLIFDDIQSLADILLKNDWRINFLFAGKAHPADEPGKAVLKLILDNQKELYERSQGRAKLVFIPNYDMAIAKMMVAGVHAWLNSPKRPLEASGTSGMKAVMNGVPNISVMDGWWVEGYHEGKTGWKFGYEGPVDEANLSEDPASLLYEEDADSFYRLLPEILATFYHDPERYLDVAIGNLELNVPIFNTHRMAAEYVKKYNLNLTGDIAERMTYFASLYQSESPDDQ